MRLFWILMLCWLVPAYAAAPQDPLSSLGLTLLPTKVNQVDAPLVIFLSGDGGWAPLDKGVSKQLQLRGLPVVGWNSLTYYWTKKTPQQVTDDLVRILDRYGPRWQKRQVLLIGFSFGAEIVPFVLNRLPPAYRQHVMGGVMLSPSTSSDFEIHVSEMLSTSQLGQYATEPEVKRIQDIPLLCFYGLEDDDPELLCPRLQQQNVTSLGLTGGHHFEDDYPQLAHLILRHLLPSLDKAPGA